MSHCIHFLSTRRSKQNIYDFVESEKVYKFLTTRVQVVHDPAASLDSKTHSIFDKSPKIYRRFQNLEKYNEMWLQNSF